MTGRAQLEGQKEINEGNGMEMSLQLPVTAY